MNKDKEQAKVPDEDKTTQKLPDTPTPVQDLPDKEEEKPEVDVSVFIEEIKNSTDLPEDIYSALNEARSRVRMEIPDPPADLWDKELDDLAELPNRPLPHSSALINNFPDLFGGESEDRLHEPTEAELDLSFFSALPSLKTADVENQIPDADSEEDETSELKSDKEELTEGEAPESKAAEETAIEEKSSKKKKNKTKAKTKVEGKSEASLSPSTVAEEPVLTEEEVKAKRRRRINPWSLLFGKNNVVDATATLIFLHAVIMLTFEIVWLRLPAEWIGIRKNSFIAFALVSITVQVVALLFPIFLSFNTYRLPSTMVMGKTKIDKPLAFASLLLGIPAALFFNCINNLFTYALVTLDITLPTGILPSYVRPNGTLQFFVSLILAVLLPAILEELFFRGFVQKAFLGLKGPSAAIYLSALAFTYYHNDPLYILAPFGIGVLLGKLRFKSESILPTMLASLSIGLTTYLLDPLLPRFDAQMVLLFPSHGLSNLSANLVAMLSSGTVLFFIYRFISDNLLKSRAFVGFSTGKRAALYGRNQRHKELVLYSPDRQYKAPALTLPNYIRLLLACIIALVSRFLA